MPCGLIGEAPRHHTSRRRARNDRGREVSSPRHTPSRPQLAKHDMRPAAGGAEARLWERFDVTARGERRDVRVATDASSTGGPSGQVRSSQPPAMPTPSAHKVSMVELTNWANLPFFLLCIGASLDPLRLHIKPRLETASRLTKRIMLRTTRAPVTATRVELATAPYLTRRHLLLYLDCPTSGRVTYPPG